MCKPKIKTTTQQVVQGAPPPAPDVADPIDMSSVGGMLATIAKKRAGHTFRVKRPNGTIGVVGGAGVNVPGGA